MSCTSCGSETTAGARFCHSCGHPVALAQPEERRIVTVLFADLVGFTALAERLDPEQVKRLVDGCFARLVEVVHEFGGKVDKILGDGMLVLFGAPVAHEDDPERAVRAGLRMQEILAGNLAGNVAGSENIRMRVGINTGEVLVGTLAGTDYTAMGDVVNTASRLQAEAPPGGVLVGEATHDLTETTFRYEAAGQLRPRGREQSLTAWLAVAPVVPPGSRTHRRRDLPIVGRVAELALASAALELVAGDGRGVLLHVTGDSGVGKSRLVDEVIARARDLGDVSVLEGACVPYGEANIWWPIASALSSYLDLDVGAPLDRARTGALLRSPSMSASIEPHETERLVDVITHLFGYPSPIDRLDPVSARNAIHHTVSILIESRSSRDPVVLSIDDLHWADPVVLDLLEHLVTSLSRHRFMLVTAMRPGSDAAWPPRSERSGVLSVMLQPLSREHTDELAMSLLGIEATRDAPLLGALYERSGGNPLFLLELVALTEAGGGQLDLPDSLRTLIAARLDQLTPAQRQMVENAAVLGTSGAVSGLERFAREVHQPFEATTLHELEDLGLLEVRGRRWEFRSDSVRDAAYQTLTKSARARRHAGVARALEGAVGQLDDRAHHTATAAELVQELGSINGVPPTVVSDALRLLTSAAARALEVGSLRIAVRHASRALDLSADHSSANEVAHLRLTRAAALTEQRLYEAAAADIDALLAAADALDDGALRAEAFRLLGSLSHAAGRLDDARRELGQAVDLLRHEDSPALLARALRMRGFIEVFGGSLVDAEWFLGEADQLYTSLADERGQAYVEQHRAWIAFLSGDLEAAHVRLTHSATAHERLGDRNGVGWANGLLAFVEFFQGHFAEAEALASTIGPEAEQRGDTWAAAMMNALLADLRLWQGKLEDAATLAETARVRFRQLNDKFGLVQALSPLLRAQVALGRNAAAQRSSEELLTLAETASSGPNPLMAVAGAAMHRGNPDLAVAMAERAIAAIDIIGGAAFEPKVVLALGFAQLGRLDDALATLESLPKQAANHPFTQAITALVLTASGAPQQALEHSAAVSDLPGSTYLDQVFAFVAAGAACARLGQPAQAELHAQAAVARALNVGDVVATALATTLFEAITGMTHPASDATTVLGDGWQHLVKALVGSFGTTFAASASQRPTRP